MVKYVPVAIQVYGRRLVRTRDTGLNQIVERQDQAFEDQAPLDVLDERCRQQRCSAVNPSRLRRSGRARTQRPAVYDKSG